MNPPTHEPAPDLPRVAPLADRAKVFAVLAMLLLAVVSAYALLGPTRPAGMDPPPDATHRVRINHADAAELQLLPGVGDITARNIIEDRDRNGTFKSVDDLRRVRGIGPKISERMAPYITFD